MVHCFQHIKLLFLFFLFLTFEGGKYNKYNNGAAWSIVF